MYGLFCNISTTAQHRNQCYNKKSDTCRNDPQSQWYIWTTRQIHYNMKHFNTMETQYCFKCVMIIYKITIIVTIL